MVFIAYAWIFGLACILCVINAKVSESEMTALFDLYNSTDGSHWLWKNTSQFGPIWDFTVPSPNPCVPQWQGIDCSCVGSMCSIVELSLDKYNMTGRIPSSIVDLTQLHHLIFSNNHLSGSIPSSLGGLTSLLDVNLLDNELFGQLPSSFGSLQHLKSLILSNNRMNGTIPPELCNLKNLTNLEWSRNGITKTIPSCIGELSSLSSLVLNENALTGRIPESIVLLASQIKELSMSHNNLTGSLPHNIFNATNSSQLFAVYLNHNSLTGPLPEINLPVLTFFDLSSNYFSGTLSSGICHSQDLFYFSLSYNQIHGNLPSNLSNLMLIEGLTLNNNFFSGPLPVTDRLHHVVSYYELSRNSFTGTIPVSMCLNNFYTLNLGNNLLHGPVPDCLNTSGYKDKIGSLLYYYSISNNLLSGPIPSYLENQTYLQSLTLNDNLLTGTLPSFPSSPLLFYLYAQNNRLNGPINLSSNLTIIQYVDVSNNYFSGTLPYMFFKAVEHLISFAAASNCITGSISSEICTLSQLVFLNLDGLSTAKHCRAPIFPNIPEFTSFGLVNQIEGAIPVCLFSMPNLETLHVSGNSIDWNFPSQIDLGVSLSVLSLSHNRLSGSIPQVIQNRQWTTLDVSFNKLVGTIDFESQDSENSSLVLQVNRLSGNVPSSLFGLKSVNVLTGNIFGCDFERNGLPSHDPAYKTYPCGSNSFNQAAIAWICFGAPQALLLLMVIWCKYNDSVKFEMYFSAQWKLLNSYFSVFSEKFDKTLHSFQRNLCALMKLICFLTLGIEIVFLPVYSGLKSYYKTSDYQYAWTVSAAYLSGMPPAIVLLVCYLLVIFVLFGIWYELRKNVIRSAPKRLSESCSKYRLLHMCVFTEMVLINCLVMVLVNAGYVIIVLNFNTEIVFVAQLAIALFKLIWNDFAVNGMVAAARWILRKASSPASSNDDSIKVEMPYTAFIVLFNSIIAPLFATAAVDSNCFYNVFVALQPVSTEFRIYNPEPSCGVGGEFSTTCTIVATVSYLDVSYDPPFIYSYQCTSSLLTNYASVYVYMYLTVAFVKPFALICLHRFYSGLTPRSWTYSMVDGYIPTLLKPASSALLEEHRPLFHKDRFVLRMIAKVAVLLTFGVIFPPLAVVVCVAFGVELLLNLFIMGRFLMTLPDDIPRQEFTNLLAHDCQGCLILLLNPLAKLVVPFAAIFYSFFVFDIYGDAVGFRGAIWATVLLMLTPILLLLGFTISRYYGPQSMDGSIVEIERGNGGEVTLNALYHDKNDEDL